MSFPRRAGAIVVSVGAVVTLIGTFLTWVRSGATGRSSYELFELVDRLGFSPDGLVGWALRVWPLVPMLLVLAVVGAWWHPSHPAWAPGRIALTALAAVYAGGTALAVANAPDITLFTVRSGPVVTSIGAGVMIAGLVVEPLISRLSPA